MVAIVAVILVIMTFLLGGCGTNDSSTISTKIKIEDAGQPLDSIHQPSFDSSKNLWTAKKPINGNLVLHIYESPGPGQNWELRFFTSKKMQSLNPADYTREVSIQPGDLIGSYLFPVEERYLIVSNQKDIQIGYFTFLDVVSNPTRLFRVGFLFLIGIFSMAHTD
jgi:hypothetical protein